MDQKTINHATIPVPVAPPAAVASPTELGVSQGEIPYYLPSWTECARYIGWRWIYILFPLAFVAAALFLIPVAPYLLQFAIGWWKLLVIAIALPSVAFINAAKRSIQNRKDPFCIHCGYTLLGLPSEHHCPECGHPYSHRIIEEYRRDPHWFIERHRHAKTLPRADVAFAAGPKRSKRSRDGT